MRCHSCFRMIPYCECFPQWEAECEDVEQVKLPPRRWKGLAAMLGDAYLDGRRLRWDMDNDEWVEE